MKQNLNPVRPFWDKNWENKLVFKVFAIVFVSKRFDQSPFLFSPNAFDKVTVIRDTSGCPLWIFGYPFPSFFNSAMANIFWIVFDLGLFTGRHQTSLFWTPLKIETRISKSNYLRSPKFLYILMRESKTSKGIFDSIKMNVRRIHR